MFHAESVEYVCISRLAIFTLRSSMGGRMLKMDTRAALVDYVATHPKSEAPNGGPALSRASSDAVPNRLLKFMTKLTEKGMLVTGEKERKVHAALDKVRLIPDRSSRIKRWIHI